MRETTILLKLNHQVPQLAKNPLRCKVHLQPLIKLRKPLYLNPDSCRFEKTYLHRSRREGHNLHHVIQSVDDAAAFSGYVFAGL